MERKNLVCGMLSVGPQTIWVVCVHQFRGKVFTGDLSGGHGDYQHLESVLKATRWNEMENKKRGGLRPKTWGHQHESQL